MCNGFLTLDYTDNIASTGTGIPYGLWDLDDNFTFECVLTPYEINGYGTYRTAGSITNPSNITKTTIGSGDSFNTSSKKIMPGLSQAVFTATEQNNFQSELYLPRASRITHEMRIFHSTNFQVSLVNDTLHNENNPAKYKIKVGIKLGTASMEYFTSDAVILPNLGKQYDSFVEKGFEDDGKVKYKSIGSTTSVFSSKSANLANANQHLFDGKEVFIRDGLTFTSFGIVDSATSSALTLKLDPSVSVPSGSEIFIHGDFFEPAYINNTYHIACAWDNQNKGVNIFFNGRLVKTGTHTQTDSFTMEAEDFYIGANGGGATGANSATTNNQFMGELHELSIMSINKSEFNAVNNLMPNLNDTVLYLRFEEVDD